MTFWKKMAWQSMEELARYSSATKNLACAEGLPGTSGWDSRSCLAKIKEMAERVRWQTVRNYRRFERDPGEFHNSTAYYRALVLVSTLQTECGVRYNPEKIPEQSTLEPVDSFVYGAVMGAGGTCASLPVLYATVGQYLGYPLHIVAAKTPRWTHRFVRWHDHSNRFNIETTATGFISDPDDHYRREPYDVKAEDEKTGGFLRTQNPREELANYLMTRFHCWRDAGRLRFAVEAAAYAFSLVPNSIYCRHTLNKAFNDWQAELSSRRPPRFPIIEVSREQRFFPSTLPPKDEMDFLAMCAMENLLNDPRHEKALWQPLRQGRPIQAPVAAVVRYAADGSCSIRFSDVTRFPNLQFTAFGCSTGV